MSGAYQPGQTATLEQTYGSDASVITIEIHNSAGDILIADTPYGISHPALGVYLYAWPIPPDQAPDTITARWTATVNGATTTTEQTITVDGAGGLPGTWCSLADVATFTGHTEVTQDELNAAQVILEGHIHRVWRPTDSAKRDWYWLRRATAFQALYVHDHPEILSMMDPRSISQDGLSISFGAATQSLPIIAPIARRILDAMFRGSNVSVRMNSAFQKNRMTRAGVGGTGSSSWTPM